MQQRLATIEELIEKGSAHCQETFSFLRSQLTSNPDIAETVDYEPLKQEEAPTYEVANTPRVRAFFGEKLELFLFMPEKVVPSIQNDETIPLMLRDLVNKAQLGGMSRLLRVQVASKDDVQFLMPLILAITRR